MLHSIAARMVRWRSGPRRSAIPRPARSCCSCARISPTENAVTAPLPARSPMEHRRGDPSIGTDLTEYSVVGGQRRARRHAPGRGTVVPPRRQVRSAVAQRRTRPHRPTAKAARLVANTATPRSGRALLDQRGGRIENVLTVVEHDQRRCRQEHILDARSRARIRDCAECIGDHRSTSPSLVARVRSTKQTRIGISPATVAARRVLPTPAGPTSDTRRPASSRAATDAISTDLPTNDVRHTGSSPGAAPRRNRPTGADAAQD